MMLRVTTTILRTLCPFSIHVPPCGVLFQLQDLVPPRITPSGCLSYQEEALRLWTPRLMWRGCPSLAAHGCACRLPCIPTPDEFPMNSERPYIFFRPFFETSCELVDNVREFDSKDSKRTSENPQKAKFAEFLN